MTELSPETARLRDEAQQVFLAGVSAADPHRAVKASIHSDQQGGILIAGKEFKEPQSLFVVAIGKGGCRMAQAVVKAMTERSIDPSVFRTPGIIVVNEENAHDLDGFDVFVTGHPLPSEEGVRAAARIEEYLAPTTEADGVLLLLSGGGSALLPAPAEGITLADKRRVTELLLASGADIHELNTVRKHLSRLKGGGLAQAASPAAMEVLILSDVFDDDLSTIASGPAVADPTTYDDAINILKRRSAWDNAPQAVRKRFEAGASGAIDETPKPGDSIFDRVAHRIIGSNSISLQAAIDQARELGYEVDTLSEPLTGEAREVARHFADRLRAATPSPDVPRKRAFLTGGETTVTVKGTGRGGRNQELSLALAIGLGQQPPKFLWAFLSGGTDGRDGPTDAAGGVIDALTLARGHSAGADAAHAMVENDSYEFLKASNDLLMTGGTGTNVADLQVLLYEI